MRLRIGVDGLGAHCMNIVPENEDVEEYPV